LTLLSVGRVGRAHGFDGSFWVEDASHSLPLGTEVVLGDRTVVVERRGGTDQRPLIRLSGVTDPRAHGGELMLVEGELEEGEWLASDLVDCEVLGLGRVRKITGGPSCDVLELEDGTLVPLVSDAVVEVDVAAGKIVVNRVFLGLEPPGE
jgi:16S rRNA processing protein RimM